MSPACAVLHLLISSGPFGCLPSFCLCLFAHSSLPQASIQSLFEKLRSRLAKTHSPASLYDPADRSAAAASTHGPESACIYLLPSLAIRLHRLRLLDSAALAQLQTQLRVAADEENRPAPLRAAALVSLAALLYLLRREGIPNETLAIDMRDRLALALPLEGQPTAAAATSGPAYWATQPTLQMGAISAAAHLLGSFTLVPYPYASASPPWAQGVASSVLQDEERWAQVTGDLLARLLRRTEQDADAPTCRLACW
jgi:hypothetical protein